jgi:hypothetical protein
LVALLIGLSIALPVTAFERTHYFCKMMDRVMATRCCGTERQPVEVASRAQARSSDCCVPVAAKNRAVTPSTRAAAVQVVPVVTLATLADPVLLTPSERSVRSAPAQARAPPPRGPPLFVVHCSFLI